MKQKKGEGIYNVIVIGAGAAGLVTTASVASLGGRAALIEKNKMGGDCLNFGCVPSKALISSARLIQNIRESERWGLNQQEPDFDFRTVFESMRACRRRIEPNDSKERFEELGVDVFPGAAKFISPHEVEVNGQRLRARHFVIAAGSRAGIPHIEGIEAVPFFANETIFDSLNEKPESMIVIGGGPIGCELGQVMNRMGVKVRLVQRAPHILIREDSEISQVLQQNLEKEGMEVYTGMVPRKVYRENGDIVMRLQKKSSENDETRIKADALLVAAGRVPNVEHLGLEAAGVAYNKQGIITNEYLQTSQAHIWAAGDIAGPYQFTHTADYHARTVARNILMPFPFLYTKVDYSVIPWATYTSPEVARVGLNEREAKAKSIPYDLFKLNFNEVDRSILDREDTGFIKVLTTKGKDRILGVTIVGKDGGGLLHEFVLAMKNDIGLGKIAATIHAYPTVAETARKLGDAYNKTRFTPRLASLFSWLFRRQLKA